jgi:hypothetical protein
MPRSVTENRCARPRSVTWDSSVQTEESIVYVHTKLFNQIPNMRDKEDQGRRAEISGLFWNLIVQWRHRELSLVERVVCSERGSDVSRTTRDNNRFERPHVTTIDSKGHTRQQSILKATRDNNRFFRPHETAVDFKGHTRQSILKTTRDNNRF